MLRYYNCKKIRHICCAFVSNFTLISQGSRVIHCPNLDMYRGNKPKKQQPLRFEDDAVHVRDLNATILHQLGIDHTRLTFPFQGLDQKLTGVEEAHVVRKILS